MYWCSSISSILLPVLQDDDDEEEEEDEEARGEVFSAMKNRREK